jgi:cytochrome P450
VLTEQNRQACLKEALRIHPAVGFPLERYVSAGGTTICGYDIPAGVNISVNPFVVHMDEDVFGKDAESYRPERWLEASEEQLKAMERSFMAVRLSLLTT